MEKKTNTCLACGKKDSCYTTFCEKCIQILPMEKRISIFSKYQNFTKAMIETPTN